MSSSSIDGGSPKAGVEMTSFSTYSNPSFKDETGAASPPDAASPVKTTTTPLMEQDTDMTANIEVDSLTRDFDATEPPSPTSSPPSYDDVDGVEFQPEDDGTADVEEGLETEHGELILKIRKTLPMKDFTHEIRARRDLERFLVKSVVALDVPHTELYLIVEDLLKKLRTDLDIDERITSQAAKAFFTFKGDSKHSLVSVSVDELRETIQGVVYGPDETNFEQTWVTTVCSLPNLKQSHVAIARLIQPVNLGTHCEEVQYVVLVIAPQKEKFTKSSVEIGRTFSSLLSDSSFRALLHDATTDEEFKGAFEKYIKDMDAKLEHKDLEEGEPEVEFEHVGPLQTYTWKQFGRGVFDDLKRRIPHYKSDYVDGVVGKNTIPKLLATIFFLYFACLLPDIAFGTVYEEITDGKLNVYTCILSQTIGGLLFAIFSGQPLLVMLTTAPLALYVKVIKLISLQFSFDFLAMYTMVGLWNAIFLLLEAFFNLSQLMKYSTRSTEEIFGFFIALAFMADAIKETQTNFKMNYNFPGPEALKNTTALLECHSEDLCYRPENSLLFILLMLGTLWLGISLLKFEQSPYLSAGKREVLADYALPISVVVFSFVGSYLFREVSSEPFQYDSSKTMALAIPDLTTLSVGAHFAAMGLGLSLSCLFFVDQNVSAAFVNAPQNKMKKGPAYHWDLVVVALINAFLSIFNLPWVHAALPHSPLHVRALADVEQSVTSSGTVHDEIVKVRETRLTGILSHLLIGLSLFFISFLQYIPISVLQGLFLYLGFSSLFGNQMFERLMLFFTEGSMYPPSHYVRKVPQRKMHIFTGLQIFQLVIVSIFGFANQYYLKMIFPIIILLLLPIRHLILPKFIEKKYLDILDH